MDDLERMRLEQENVYGVCEVSKPSTSAGIQETCTPGNTKLGIKEHQSKYLYFSM